MIKEDYQFNYKILLTSSEWVRFRKQILDRDKVCQECGTDKRLDVHHVAYLPYKKPWEYPEEYMLTLCRDCHEEEHIYQGRIKKYIEQMRLSGLLSKEIYNLFK